MSSWHSYPSIYNLGHRALQPILNSRIQAEEKIDGSQFSFGRFDGELRVRSKGKEMVPDAPEKLFQLGVDAVAKLDLRDGWTYRGEYLSKPKHNTLKYDRVPIGHVMIFDINTGEEEYLPYDDKRAEAERIGLECVPLVYTGPLHEIDMPSLLARESVLGGTTIEGVVIKQYEVFAQDKKALMGKYVSESFKERHGRAWKESNPGSLDFIENIIRQLATEARWQKSIQHLRDNGDLENDARDIGKLLKAICSDVHTEEREWIQDQLFRYAWPKISRGLTRGFPEFYKERIAQEQLQEVSA